MTQHRFDTAKYVTARDVAHELTATEVRMRHRRSQIADLEADNKLDEHRITQLDRWMLSIFENNPDHQCVLVSVGYHDYAITPGDGVVLVHKIEYPTCLEMTPYPVETDLDDDVEYEDDFVPQPHLHNIAADLLGRNGHYHTEGQITS